MVIRKGNKNDILKVSRLWLQMVNELSPKFTPNVQMFRAHCEKFMSNGNYEMFVADEGGRIVGFLDFFLFPEPSDGKLHGVGQHFYVIPEYRGNCVSGKLYKNTIRTMKERGCAVRELCCFENEKQGWIKKGYEPLRSIVRRDI